MNEFPLGCIVGKVTDDGVVINISYDILDEADCMWGISELKD